MKKILFVVVYCSLLSFSAFAGKEDKIKELVDLTYGSQTQLEQDLSQPVKIHANEIMCLYNLNKAESKQVQIRLDNLLGTENFFNYYIQFYSDNYSEEEIDELIKIYQSPVIQKTKELRPKLESFMMQKQQIFARTIMPAIKNIDSELDVKYKKRAPDEYAKCLKDKIKEK